MFDNKKQTTISNNFKSSKRFTDRQVCGFSFYDIGSQDVNPSYSPEKLKYTNQMHVIYLGFASLG